MRRNNQICLGVLFTLLFSACVWEDMADCDLSLHLKYDYNKESSDLILEEVEQLDLFIFAEDGSLYKQLSLDPQTEGTSIVIPLEGGTYHLLAWGNIPPPTHQDVSYRYDAELGELTYQNEELEFNDSILGMFWGETLTFTIDGETDNEQEVSLIKNTKHIDVVIIGSVTETSCELFAENRNHDNKNTPFDLLNSAPRRDAESGNLVYRFNTHRLLASDAAKSGLKFFGKLPKASAASMLVNESLIDLLLANPNIDDLDRFDYYRIELIFAEGFLTPMIKVNGWIVVDMPSDL